MSAGAYLVSPTATLCPTCRHMAAFDYQYRGDNRWIKYPAIALSLLGGLLVIAPNPIQDWASASGYCFWIPIVPLCFLRSYYDRGRYRECRACGYRWQV